MRLLGELRCDLSLKRAIPSAPGGFDNDDVIGSYFNRLAAAKLLDVSAVSLHPIATDFAGPTAGHAERGDTPVV